MNIYQTLSYFLKIEKDFFLIQEYYEMRYILHTKELSYNSCCISPPPSQSQNISVEKNPKKIKSIRNYIYLSSIEINITRNISISKVEDTRPDQFPVTEHHTPPQPLHGVGVALGVRHCHRVFS